MQPTRAPAHPRYVNRKPTVQEIRRRLLPLQQVIDLTTGLQALRSEPSGSVTCLPPPQQHARLRRGRSDDMTSGSAPASPKPTLLLRFRKQNKATQQFAGWNCPGGESPCDPLVPSSRSVAAQLGSQRTHLDADRVTLTGCRPSTCTLNRSPAEFSVSR